MLVFATNLNTTYKTRITVNDESFQTDWYSKDLVSLAKFKGETCVLSVCTGTRHGEVLGKAQRLNHYEHVEVPCRYTLAPCTTGTLDPQGNRNPKEEERHCTLVAVDYSFEELKELASSKH